ncbi:hypothetical protein [Rossellomorea sp. BNER]|uniref:hypothetical protein n=1 Tax=Rossellomorea sp. BNER TaxID=2962031 RepID=UPI003AF29727|nr:hypothetical protein [Rossellomorea sp. BNER]
MISKKLTVVGLSIGLALSSISFSPYNVLGETSGTSNLSSMDVLENLTDTQREALKKLELNEKTGLQLSPDVSLDNDDEISVIVEFHNKPIKVSQIQASLKGEKLSKRKAKNMIAKEHKEFKEDLSKIFKDNKKKDKPYTI